MNKKSFLVGVVGFATLVMTTFLATIILFASIGGISSIFLPITVISLGAIMFFLYISFKNIKKYILRLQSDVILAQKESLVSFPAACVILDEDNTIIWYNKVFEKNIYSNNEAFGEDIAQFFNIDIEKLYTEKGCFAQHNGKVYKLTTEIVKKDEKQLSLVYFKDVTEHKALEIEHSLSRPTIILVMIDNYEDLFLNVKESEKANVSVQLEKLFEEFADNTTGVISRNAKDRFTIVVEERHIQDMLLKRFDILDKARAISVDERLCVTLSIGVGRGGKNMQESELYAKQCLDMALGRGGDQCAVKTINGFEFFGGVSKGIEKHTKVKTRIISTALRELIDTSSNVFVMGHRFGDLDSVGAAIGLAAAIRKKDKPAHVVVNPEKNLAKQLISHIEKYDIPDLFIPPEKALENIYENTLLIIVDTHNPLFVESKELLEKCKQVVVIDHHRKMINYIDNAVIFHHEPYASSACEMVSELLQYFDEKAKISSYVAEALLAGIMLDTKNFVMRTGVRTFEAAAFLRRHGADTVTVKTLFSNTVETYRQKSQLITSAEIVCKCAIACSDMQTEEMRLAAPQAADELLGISGVDASFTLFDLNGVINICARSLGSYNVQLIMEEMGGGGHQTMAGTQISDMSLFEAKGKLISIIEEFELLKK